MRTVADKDFLSSHQLTAPWKPASSAIVMIILSNKDLKKSFFHCKNNIQYNKTMHASEVNKVKNCKKKVETDQSRHCRTINEQH